MTTITSLRGRTEVVRPRRTEAHDASAFASLFTRFTEDIFGRIDVAYLLEKSTFALTLCNEKNEAIAHAIFLDYPNWNITDQSDWESFLNKNYVNNKCTPLNTLFMHLFVAKEEYAAGCSQEIIRRAFIAIPELQFILLFIPAGENLEPGLDGVFEKMMTAPGSAVDKTFTLLACPRHQHHPQLHVRKARLEDYDDLMPIWTRQSEILKETHSEYFLADIIACQDEENQAVVCEDGGTAVGFMSLCSQVDISLLRESFDLRLFHGLCKPHPEDVLQVPKEPSIPEDEDKRNQKSQEAETVSSQNLEDISDEDAAVQKDGVIAISQTKLPLDDVTHMDFHASATSFLEAEEKDTFHPIYRGTSNAFCIRLFCIDEKYETRSLDFLHYVFKLFPDKDFCIILVPHCVPEFYLIQSFVRVAPSCTSQFGRELYVFHCAGLLESFNVRRATSNDILGVKTLIKTLTLNESILSDLNTFIVARGDPDGTPVQAFVAEVLDQIVGISVIRDEMDTVYIQTHYNIEDFIRFNDYQQEEHGELYHFVLNPIFRHYTKHFLKEILRLAHKSSLFYPVYPQYAEGKFQNPFAHSLTSALHYMVPVRPRRQIVYPLEELGINAPSEQVSKDQPRYSLNHINRKLIMESKVSVNSRIVVVGASDVGISFLETLVFCPHLKFNNLTLISTHGLPGKDLPGSKHRRFLINSHCFNDEDYAQMSLCSWVNVVVGKMTGINRSAKYVVVSKERKVPYDYLVLCTGQNYQVLSPTGADISKLATNREVISKCPQRYTGKIPSNHFTLNDDQDCLKAKEWLKENFINSEGNIIVYGNTIDIYTTVETFLSLGIDGSRIHLVQPPLSSNVTCLNNNEIESAVQEALSEAGVSVYYDSILAQWSKGDDPDLITRAAFTTNSKPFQLQCSAFFSFAYKRVDYETFKAINDACLVFDGRLVIDTEFRTNDVSIRAAGPLTKYSRRYYADEWTHSNFNSKEIGFELAASMLRLFDPTPQPSSKPPEGTDSLIPMYKGCKIQGGVLPRGYNYLHISKPEVPIRLDLVLALSDHGTEIVTGKARDGNYFRMHINKYSMVDSITCFSKEPFPASNYICLYGQHERLLNDLSYRWNEGQITDLYSYFREPWSMAIYHDRFIDLQKELRQILLSEQVREMPFYHLGHLSMLFASVPSPIFLPKLCAPVELFPAHIPHPLPCRFLSHSPRSHSVFPRSTSGLPEIPTSFLTTFLVFPNRNTPNANLNLSQVPAERQTEDSPVPPPLARSAVRYLLRHGAQLPMYARGRPAGERGAGR
ncbi:LOW QUALITY PROTEIN: cilia- and flagella-associated protein 61 [Lagopus leucura]|uniref:LOW QUALITY PROTEIN: cilia- and flagella-associated protein 61 n=1 Tax=Lagopus leucura TaxID=30410 RepID=UPI001C67BBFF|nr:LOW QUALITY PROTEIN: cilia- and flagella-associated protein 61 [Lagopus leucura]